MWITLLAVIAEAATMTGPGPHPTLLKDYAETRGFSLGRPVQPRPLPDGRAVLFLRSGPRDPRLALYRFEVASGATRRLLDPGDLLAGGEEQLSFEERARRERMRVSSAGFTSYQLSEDGRLALVTLSGQLWVLPTDGGAAPRRLTGGAGAALDPRFSPDGKRVAFVRDHDLWVVEVARGRERRLTRGGTRLRSHGVAEFVAQEEMGRFAGYWWAPDGKAIAYEEADARGVELFHLADPGRPEAAAHALPYPRPGRRNADVRLGVVPVGGGATRWVRWDRERFPYLATVAWPRGGPLTMVVQARDQRTLVVVAADAQTGRTRPLVEERDAAWLNLDQDVPRWLPDGSAFLWTTERAGAPELELRDPGGALVRVLVPPDGGYRDLVGVDGAGVLWLGGPEPTEQHLYRVPLAGGPSVRLTQGTGWFGAVAASEGGLVVRVEDRPRALQRMTVHRADGREAGVLPSVAEAPPFLPETELCEVDGFRARVTRPRGFDPARRYPVAVDVYGGPRHQRVKADAGSLLAQWIADHGVVVVSMDGRGTPSRGRAWERAIAGSFAAVPLDDQVRALEALGRRFPWMDTSRTGIFGWSFGGYLAALAVLRRPDVFKVAVAGAPVADWEYYDTHYTERYLGLPAHNPQGYRDSNLLTWAAGLARPLLLVHGTSDDNVYFVHTLKLSDALFRAGKPHELLALPGLTHMVPDPVVMERLWARIAGFLTTHLSPG